LVLAFIAAEAATLQADEKPNIVFILADDMGWSDMAFNDGKVHKHFYEAPNLDQLANDGMVFSRAYSGGPNCLPMRACLISGMYTPRTQIWTPGGRSKGPIDKMKLLVPRKGDELGNVFPSKLELEPSVVSIAEVLNSAGYATGRFGKWHVGKDNQGFDVSDYNGKGATSGKFYGNVNVHEWLTDASCRFIESNKEKPFFLYLAHWDVHSPIRARKEVTAKYKAKLESGKWDREWNPTYAAMIEAVDKSVGRVRAKLEELGLAENTLFIFSSDNGGTPVTTMKPLKGAKGALYEGGIRVPTCMVWPKVVKPGTTCDTPVTSVDFMPTFADLGSATLPTTQPVDGVSIAPLLRGEKFAERSIFWHYPLYLQGTGAGQVVPVFGTSAGFWRGVPASAMVRGDWKLIHFHEDDSIRLYNLEDDIGETNDLAKTKPEIATSLFDELKAWQSSTKAVIPTQTNPLFEKTQSGKRASKERS